MVSGFNLLDPPRVPVAHGRSFTPAWRKPRGFRRISKATPGFYEPVIRQAWSVIIGQRIGMISFLIPVIGEAPEQLSTPPEKMYHSVPLALVYIISDPTQEAQNTNTLKRRTMIREKSQRRYHPIAMQLIIGKGLLEVTPANPQIEARI